MSGKGSFPKQRNPHSRCLSKVNYRQHVPFHDYFSKYLFENCPSLLSAVLLLHIASHLSQEDREHRHQKHWGTQNSEPSPRQPFLYLLRTEYRAAQASWIQILLPFRSRQAHGKKLRPFKGLPIPSSSILLAPFMHTSLQLWPAQSFQASSLSFSSGLLHSPADAFHSWTRGKTCQKRQTDPVSFSSAAGEGHMKYFWWEHMMVFQGSWPDQDAAVFMSCPLPIHKNSQKGMEMKRRPMQQLNWGLNTMSFPASAAALTALWQGLLQFFC